jgi:hypothetical protein
MSSRRSAQGRMRLDRCLFCITFPEGIFSPIDTQVMDQAGSASHAPKTGKSHFHAKSFDKWLELIALKASLHFANPASITYGA